MRLIQLLSMTIIWLAIAAHAEAATPAWPAFRGPNGSGVSDSAKPPIRFGPETNVLWKIDVAGAPSSPCVWGDRIFLTTFSAGKLRTHCFERRTGKELWQRVAAVGKIEDFNETEGSPAASTPVTDGRRVVTYFGSGGLYCYDFNGKALWHYPLPTAETDGGFGTGTSPLWAGNRVILNRDERSKPALLALDAATGKVAWETPRP